MFNLKELRKENGMKRSELANATGIHQSTLANYENGTREAPYEVLILLADFFQVSLDELLGRENTPFFANNLPQQSTDEKDLLKRYRLLSNKDKERLKDYLLLLSRNN